jgi:hypothetical protein
MPDGGGFLDLTNKRKMNNTMHLRRRLWTSITPPQLHRPSMFGQACLKEII